MRVAACEGRPPNKRIRTDWRYTLQQSAYPSIDGRTTPYLSRIGSTVPALNDLNHNSSADYIVDQQSYSMGGLLISSLRG